MLPIGRSYRKSISQLWSAIVFRWAAIWIIVALCAAKGQAFAYVVIAADLIAYQTGRGLIVVLGEQSRKDWLDRLTNRFFYKLLFEEIRRGRVDLIDVDELFKCAAAEAVADIKSADDPSIGGVFDTKVWHVVGGILAFFGMCVGFGLYYGSALVVGGG